MDCGTSPKRAVSKVTTNCQEVWNVDGKAALSTDQSDCISNNPGSEIVPGFIKVVVRYSNVQYEIPSVLLADTTMARHTKKKRDFASAACCELPASTSRRSARIYRGQATGSDDVEGYTLETDLVRCPRGILNDTDGSTRGAYVSLHGNDQAVLHLLRKVYDDCEKKLGHVQKYTKHLLHFNLQSPGFPVSRCSADHELFSASNPAHVSEMEAFITIKIREQLTSIGYCSKDQDLQLYLSFLKTLKTEVQPPHIDYHWQNISPQDFHKRPRSYKGNYKEWVPFIALFPLSRDGMTVEVWNARSKHDVPENKEDETGILVDIPFGEILLLRADVVHAGGFATAPSGNPRGHFYIYKTPRGVQHSYPLSNCYDTEISGKRLPLLEFYKHCSESAKTSTVQFVRFYSK